MAEILSAVIYGCFQLERENEMNNAVSITLGVVMILFAQVLHYGAELESGKENGKE